MMDVPAIFLYSPEYTYIVPKSLNGLSNEPIEEPSARFDEIEKLYINKNKILKFNN